MLGFLTFVLINLLAAMSPGPDFAIVMRYALTGSRRLALYSSLGVALALVVHVLYCLLGVVAFLHSNLYVFRTIQLLGATYLGYLGVRLIFQKREPTVAEAKTTHNNALVAGALTNLLNPKATLFLMSLFAQFIGQETPIWEKLAFGVSVPITALVWFSVLSVLLTHPALFQRIQRYQRGFSVCMGCVLLGLFAYIAMGTFLAQWH